jgi:putative Mn2+ efflux pump MntP
MKKYISHFITALISSVMTASLLVVCGFIYIIQPFQKDAVDRGFAIWEVTNNATGQTKFQWVDYSAAEALAQNEQPLSK